MEHKLTYRDLVVISRFSIINDALMDSERTMVALLHTENELGKSFGIQFTFVML